MTYSAWLPLEYIPLIQHYTTTTVLLLIKNKTNITSNCSWTVQNCIITGSGINVCNVWCMFIKLMSQYSEGFECQSLLKHAENCKQYGCHIPLNFSGLGPNLLMKL